MIGRVLKKRLHRPEALGLLARDCWGRRRPVLSNQRHLEEAAHWLLRAQAATPDAGVSAGYSFEDGWIASYSETTGYIIPTLLRYADYCGNTEYRARALAMAEWELTVQLSCGGFPGHFVDQSHPPVVFNTGQVIFGLLAAAAALGDKRFLQAAERAGAWLMRVQDADGAWRSFDFGGHVHAYNTRTAWALIELAAATQDNAVAAAGVRHLDWVLQHTQPNGWFQHAAFEPTKDPVLHTIAYTAQGLLEAGMKLGRSDYVAAAERAARQILGHVRADGFIPATFNSAWRPTARYSCLTGNAQMSIVWLRLFARGGDPAFRDAAVCANRFLKSVQDCETSNPHIRGAIKGSHPLWGGYLFGTYSNWAAKFFMDALLLEETTWSGDVRCKDCW